MYLKLTLLLVLIRLQIEARVAFLSDHHTVDLDSPSVLDEPSRLPVKFFAHVFLKIPQPLDARVRRVIFLKANQSFQII